MNHRFDRGLRVLIVANFVVVFALAALMFGGWLQILPRFGGEASPSVSASPTPDLMKMGLAHIPTSADCLLCHEQGGTGGLKPIPALGHPLAGWTACLVCHTNQELGRAAPGHEGIAESECLSCHKVAPPGPAITQAHSVLDKPCLDCHGSVAHLPSSMVGRNQDECWLCHKPAPQPPPLEPHPVPNAPCRTCHQAADVGALPIDHALRADDTCVLCHDVGSPSASQRPATSATPIPTLAVPTPTLAVPTPSPATP